MEMISINDEKKAPCEKKPISLGHSGAETCRRVFDLSSIIEPNDEEGRSVGSILSTTVTRVTRWYLSYFKIKGEDVRTQMSRDTIALSLTIFPFIISLYAILLLPTHHGTYAWVSFIGVVAMSTALLLYLRNSKKGLNTCRNAFAVVSSFFFLPWWALRRFTSSHGDSIPLPCMSIIHTHTITILLFTLSGGSIDTGLVSAYSITIAHSTSVVGLLLLEYFLDECSHSAIVVADSLMCVTIYLNLMLTIAIVDWVAYLLLLLTRRKLELESVVASAVVDNCLPKSISHRINEQIYTAILEASYYRPSKVVRRHLREQPELVGFHVSGNVGVHHNVSVLFADICGFTQASAKMSPDALVAVLRDVFQDIDWLCITYHIEKIKTIGDAYMACSKLKDSEDPKQGALSLVQLGVTITQLKSYQLGDTEVTFRVGIHTGTIVSGVIGLTKFSFDVWGDTVNIASRMESTSLPGKVQVTQQTYEFTREHLTYVPRTVVIKGSRLPMTTYILDDGKCVSPASSSSSTNSTRKDAWSKCMDSRSSDTSSQRTSVASLPNSFPANPLVVGPSLFRRPSSGNMGSKASKRSLKHGKTVEVVVQNSFTSGLATPSLAEDFMSMISPKRKRGEGQQQVYQWLASMQLQAYSDLFEEHGWCSLAAVSLIQPEDLDLMGVHMVGVRRCILSMAQNLTDFVQPFKTGTPVSSSVFTERGSASSLRD